MWTVMVWCRSVPLLHDARPVVLENTAHGGLFGGSWWKCGSDPGLVDGRELIVTPLA